MEKNYFVITYSKDTEVEIISNMIKRLSTEYPDKHFLVIPDGASLKCYSKEQLINILDFYIKYTRDVINDKII